MLFSVVIPTYNRAKLLPHTLDSVWRQSFTDFETVVVDDGSTDETHEYLLSLGDKVRVVRQENRGPGASRNAGACAARGDYIALLDSDDLWFPWTLNIFANAIKQFGRPTIVGGRVVEFTDEAKLFAIQEETYQTSWFSDFIASSHFPYYVGSGTCALKREAWTGMQFLEDRLNAEDHDLILQMGTAPGFVRVLSPVTLAWRRHSTSATGEFGSTVSGTLRLLARERSGAYPGGVERARERHRILARHTRPTTLACLHRGELQQGWELYRSTLGWHVELGSWKYILVFPIFAWLAWVRRAITGRTHAASNAGASTLNKRQGAGGSKCGE